MVNGSECRFIKKKKKNNENIDDKIKSLCFIQSMDDDGMCLAIGYNEEDLFRHLLLSIDNFFLIFVPIFVIVSVHDVYKCRKLNANQFHAKQMK